MQLYVGQTALRGEITAYARRFSLLELAAEPGALPRRSRLRGWRAETGEHFVFSVRLPSIVGRLEQGSARSEALERALGVAEALEARWLVLCTPAEVTPCEQVRQRLRRLGAELGGGRQRIAWEARGLWEDAQEEAMARELDWVVVRDLRRRPSPPGDVVYTRLLALGSSSRQNEAGLARVAERIASKAEAFVLVEGGGGARVRDYLARMEP
jgi:uncharacterized protein YecE (DUF72 family)